MFSGFNEEFTIGGQTYIVTALFTHGNGIQFRFGRRSGNTIVQDNAIALAFIAADLRVDAGIAGQAPFRTSVMENVSGIWAAQYRTYAGRFTGGETYTISISEVT